MTERGRLVRAVEEARRDVEDMPGNWYAAHYWQKAKDALAAYDAAHDARTKEVKP